MASSLSQAPKAVRLFDELFSDQPTQDPRIPLGKINANGTRGRKKSTSMEASGDDRKKRIADRIKEKVQKPEVQFASPPLWEREQIRKATHGGAGRTKQPRKNKNYPDCTKDALLDAFEKANLPDYDKIMEHELHVTVVEPWEVKRPYVEKPSTPPMKELLAVFDATQSTMSSKSTASARPSTPVAFKKPVEVSPAKKRRTRSSQDEEPDQVIDTDPEVDAIVDNSPSIQEQSTLRNNPFRRGFKNPTMASTPLVTGGTRLPSFSVASASSSRRSPQQDVTLTENDSDPRPKAFLEPTRRPPKGLRTSVAKPILMVPRKINNSANELSRRGDEDVTTGPKEKSRGSKENSLQESTLPKRSPRNSKGNSSVLSAVENSTSSRSRKSSQASSSDDTVVEAPIKKKSSLENSKKKILTTTIEVCPDSDGEEHEEAPKVVDKSMSRAARLFDRVTNRSNDPAESESGHNETEKTLEVRESQSKKGSVSMVRRSPRCQSSTESSNADETLRSRHSLDDSVAPSESRVSTHLLRRPSNLSSFFGCSTLQTPATYRKFNVVTDRRLHPTLKNMTLNSSKLGASFLGNPSDFGNSTAFGRSLVKRRQSRFRSIVPDQSNSRRTTKTTTQNVSINDPNELRNLLQHSIATAFNQTKLVFDDGEEKILEPKDKVLALCDPSEIIPFEDALDKNFLKKITKIGEGSYGEVFKSIDAKGNDIILKIVPFDPEKSTEEVFASLLPELIICSTFNQLREGANEHEEMMRNKLNGTPNFINMNKAVTVEGRFPRILVEKWDDYDQSKPDGSENPDPRDYGDKHLHMLMFLNNGGTDLESHKFKSATEALSVLFQVAFSLAAAELEYEFEHRDLHIGNVLVMATKETEHKYLVAGARYTLPTHGVTASIIDFSLSRLSKDGFVMHTDLSSDDELFKGSGDYQFEIYRKMKEATGNNWERFCPQTNIFWLHYLIGKLLAKKFTSKAKAHRDAIDKFKKLEEKVLDYESCHQLILSKTFDAILNN